MNHNAAIVQQTEERISSLPSPARMDAEQAKKEPEPAVAFLVGALLYSLFALGKSETISAAPTDNERS